MPLDYQGRAWGIGTKVHGIRNALFQENFPQEQVFATLAGAMAASGKVTGAGVSAEQIMLLFLMQQLMHLELMHQLI